MGKQVKNKPELNIDEICQMIVDGKTYRQMAEHYKVSTITLHKYVSELNHSVRVREAIQISADSYADKAEQILLEIKKDATHAEIMAARELHQYYKWKAAKRNPRSYSDKLDLTTKGEKLNKMDLSHLSFEELKELQKNGRSGNEGS